VTELIRGDGGWPSDRAVLVEFDAGGRARPARSCGYHGVRVAERVYIRHTAAPDPVTRQCHPIDETEHYDLEADPHQLENLRSADPLASRAPGESELEERLQARLDALRTCAGIAGRDPLPVGRSYCE
jgi:hypothetical protein